MTERRKITVPSPSLWNRAPSEAQPPRRRIITPVEMPGFPVMECPSPDQRVLRRRVQSVTRRRIDPLHARGVTNWDTMPAPGPEWAEMMDGNGEVNTKLLTSPYPYFGGKSRIAPEIWSRLDGKTIDCYIEPCMGSAATYLVRPQPWRGREILNDYDSLLVNAWRAISRAPDEVAEICCGIIRAESEMHAIHAHLTRIRDEIRPHVEGSTDFCNVKLGAWWLWGICMKLGGGWCSGEGPWHVVDGMLVNGGEEDGKGICREKPLAERRGLLVKTGITRSVPCVGNRGVLRQDVDILKEWMRALAYRLQNALILNGDWSRAVTPAMMGLGKIGIMFDPPYGAEAEYNSTLYTNQDADISTKIKEWCLQQTDEEWCDDHDVAFNPDLRIAYCGYSPEGDILTEHGWACWAWSAQGGYGNQGQANKKKEDKLGNRHRECVWFSPACGSGSDIFRRFGGR